MRTTAISVLALAGSLLIATSVRAGLFDKTGQAGMTFLKIGPEARAASMGDAFTAVSTGAASAFYNPSGVGFLDGYVDAEVSYVDWIAGIKITSASVGVPLRIPGVGRLASVALSYIATDYGSVKGTVINTSPGTKGYNDIGQLDPNELALGATIARQFTDKFSFGGTVRYVTQNLPWYNTGGTLPLGPTPNPVGMESSVNALVFDAGTMYRTGFGSSVISMSIRNFSRKQKHEVDAFALPMTFNIGVSTDVFDLVPALQEGGHRLLVAADGIHPPDHPEKLAVGGEYSFADVAFVRGGYTFNADARKYSLGVGLKGSIGGVGAGFDYAYGDFGESLGTVNYFTFSISAK